MENHLNRVDKSLEELTRKVQKHTVQKTPEIVNLNYSFDKKQNVENQTDSKFNFKSLLKPPYIFICGLPILFLILLIYLQPSFIMYTERDKENPRKIISKLSIKKLLLWTLALSCVLGVCIYYFFYMKKQNVENQTS